MVKTPIGEQESSRKEPTNPFEAREASQPPVAAIGSASNSVPPSRLGPGWPVRTLSVLCAGYFIYYLVWRLTSTLNPDVLAFSLIVLAAEAYGLVTFLLFAFMVWDVRSRSPFSLTANLKIDLYVPTYDEDPALLEATLTGCNAVTYPHTTYLLDDGRRPEVAELAARLGCLYLTRADNRHAKAGNLNAALQQTSGEFVAIVDADTVPQPDFLDKTLGYFVDDRVALVQLPQDFFNLDSAQHLYGKNVAGAWHEQELFYRVIQPGKNRWNAAFWCGSPSVVRRTALESVGGVATETVTEDIHTSIRLHARGWKTVYHDEVLAYGQAPQTIHAFAVQRLRWAQGSMQLLRSRENPLIVAGLTLAQRFNYVASMLTYFDSYQKLLLLLTPSVILLSGLLPIAVGGVDFFAHWLPYFLLVWVANNLLGRGYYRHIVVEQFNLLKMFLFLRASLVLLWPRAVTFRVTPKSIDRTVYALERAAVMPHLAALAAVALGIAAGGVNVLWGVTTSYHSGADVILVTFLWSLFNAAMLAIPIFGVLSRVYNRASYRFPVRLPAAICLSPGRWAPGEGTDISRYGARLLSSADLRLGCRLSLRLHLPDGPLELDGQIVHRGVSQEDGTHQLGVRFVNIGTAEQQRLTAFLFIIACREQRSAPGPAPATAPPTANLALAAARGSALSQ